mmetsp:Transcript_29874/g.41278  ORF Transcript_29874/g.41278 Transcript_29874/m.41278 type:complete len:185 (+) Transcript_29874:14-568(+)|eukprot:CAMPEP_0201479800 /NCGR_PEP_ID=MMETSP0151_2-20130828/4447_1 /ASSEMBLY_ACC=CAM_ASM_000257 /TAXON_ID=200890 /ORGANISM="Paramoeba atlantica, Strain 621/1 / CCAP 1560/9" /LENGTH=184 /DNA_ID=CAMNT_0047861469 /DNA_START=14 /DNA_END=568 /DNA_ORIENTATION=-
MEHKVVMIGGGGVGKSAITIQYTQNAFMEDYDPTIEDTYRKQTGVDGKIAMLEILDTAGQDEYISLREQYMMYGKAFILVYAIDSPKSFNEIHDLYQQILRVKDSDKVPVVVVANKCDLGDRRRRVSREEGQAFCQEYNLPFFECSAKDFYNVNEIFDEIVREIRGTRKGKSPRQEKRKKCSIV